MRVSRIQSFDNWIDYESALGHKTVLCTSVKSLYSAGNRKTSIKKGGTSSRGTSLKFSAHKSRFCTVLHCPSKYMFKGTSCNSKSVQNHWLLCGTLVVHG